MGRQDVSTALIAVAWAALSGCGSSKHEAPSSGKAAASSEPAPAGERPPPVFDAGPPAGETTARVVLARMFREAGLRIRHDVRLSGNGYDVTLDGYDPRRKVGFEYIDPRERGTDFKRSERQALQRAGLRVLVIDGASREATEAAARRFLEGLEPKRTRH